jgi:hypothetical protein
MAPNSRNPVGYHKSILFAQKKTINSYDIPAALKVAQQSRK